MTIAKGEPILASDIIAVVNRVTAAETAITATNTAVAGKQQNLPVGTLLMYDGAGWSDNATLPGWYICDGRNTPHGKTPDLTNLFIRGGATRGTTGGGTATLTAANLPGHAHPLSGTFTTGNNSAGHTHSVTAAGSISGTGTHNHTIVDSKHSHGYNTIQWDIDGGDIPVNSEDDDAKTISGATTSVTSNVSVKSGEGGHSHSFSGSAATSGGESANHTHTITLSGNTGNSAGTGSAFSVVPAYYTVIYIKKMA